MSTPTAGWSSVSPGQHAFAAPTKTEHAYHSLRRKILDGELAPGDPLDQEALAAGLSLLTTPVREALRRLESERLIVSRAHWSTEVAPISPESLEQTYAIRIVLDAMAVGLATAHASDEQIRYMKALRQAAAAEGRPAGAAAQEPRLSPRHLCQLRQRTAGQHPRLVVGHQRQAPDRRAAQRACCRGGSLRAQPHPGRCHRPGRGGGE